MSYNRNTQIRIIIIAKYFGTLIHRRTNVHFVFHSITCMHNEVSRRYERS
jgi:hypothetical protein